MSVKQFFAYQPIVDSTPTSVAVELIYQDEDLFADTSNTIANLVLNAFVHAGPDELPRRRQTYLKIPPHLVGSGMLAATKV